MSSYCGSLDSATWCSAAPGGNSGGLPAVGVRSRRESDPVYGSRVPPVAMFGAVTLGLALQR
jgi:hypothetical protein